MRARIDIDAEICGFHTTAFARTEDGEYVVLDIETNCEKINYLSSIMKEAGPMDAYREIDPRGESLILAKARSTLKGCFAGCAVPIGIFKAMQVAAGLAIPKDITIKMAKD